MLREYAPLPSIPLHAGASFAQPQHVLPAQVTFESPALDVMTDLSRTSAVLIRPGDTVDEAHARMKQRGVRLLLVVDAERRVLGILTATDVLGEKPMQLVQRAGTRHEEILVGDIMTPQTHLEVLRIEDVMRAVVGHVVATLKRSGRQHSAVVQSGPGGTQILRGLFSATQIARQLGVAITTAEVASTFAEIEAALAG